MTITHIFPKIQQYKNVPSLLFQSRCGWLLKNRENRHYLAPDIYHKKRVIKGDHFLVGGPF